MLLFSFFSGGALCSLSLESLKINKTHNRVAAVALCFDNRDETNFFYVTVKDHSGGLHLSLQQLV